MDKKNEHVQKVSVNGNKCLTLTYSNKKVVNVGKLLGEYSQEGVGIKELKFDDDGQAHLLLTNDTTLDVYCALGECDGENVVGVKIEDSHLFLVYSDKRTIDVGKLVKKEDL